MKRCPTGYRRNRVSKKCNKYRRAEERDEEDEEDEEEHQDEMFQDNNDPTGREPSPKRDNSFDSTIGSFIDDHYDEGFINKYLRVKSPSRKAPSRVSPPPVEDWTGKDDREMLALLVNDEKSGRSPTRKKSSTPKSSSQKVQKEDPDDYDESPADESSSVDALALAFDGLALDERKKPASKSQSVKASSAHSSRSPAKSPARSPARSPAKSPARSPARSPAKSPARSPARSAARSPARSAARSPARSPARSAEKKASSSETRKSSNHMEVISRRTLKERAANKLKRFIRKRDIVKQKAKFLNSICSDSGVCVAFGGRSAKIIKHFFKDFTGFDYVDSISPIGEKSDNGFLYSIRYVKDSYTAHAVLKSSSRADADNLMYEYGVGMEINKMFYDKYPIFVETYKCYRYKTDDIWEQFEKKTYHQSMKDALVPYKEIDYETSCKESMFICVLIQHIDKAPTFRNELKHMRVSEVLNVLYQIYFTLAAISSSYTHYDLHYDNVLLYTPVKNKFIQYHFHTKEAGVVISFKSCYVVKMIDYGRCFVKPFSEEAKKEVCDTNECAPYCGSEFGYFFNNRLKTYSIESSKKNESHDLRLLQTLREIVWDDYKTNGNRFKSESQQWLYKELLEKVHYDKKYGTPEKLETGIKTLKNGVKMVKVHNVTDASTLLQKLLSLTEEENKKTHTTHTKLGDLHVYCDGRNMEYTNA
jgi:hypothetical protein